MLRLRADYFVTYLYFSDGAFPKAQDSIPQVGKVGKVSSYTQPEYQITGSW